MSRKIKNITRERITLTIDIKVLQAAQEESENQGLRSISSYFEIAAKEKLKCEVKIDDN
jgi:hypothetical protein